jgi:hypothetical protein
MVHDLVDKLGIVQPAEDLIDHGLLIRGEELADGDGRYLPVIVHFRAQRVVERKNYLWPLRVGQAVVKGGYQGFRGSSEFRRSGGGRQAHAA